jgi:radical SAM protein with 4Fe4S-binding SPASM domain
MIKAEQVHRFLSNPIVRSSLKRLSKRDENGRALMDKVVASYAGQEKVKPQYIPYFIFFNILPHLLKMEPKKLKEVYSERFYRRAMTNIAQSVAEFGLSTPQLFSAPILVVWNFTNSCNLSCKHCYQNAHQPLPDELTLEERLKVIDELDKNDVTSLAFSGGEPLSHKDFWAVAEYAHKKGIHLSVATNGTLISKEVAGRLKDVGINYVEISVDSVKPEVHDKFRGGPGCWARTIEGVKNCVEAGILTGVATTFTKNNFDELDDMIRLAKGLKAGSFYAFNFIPTGRGKGIEEDDLTPSMREELLGTLYDTLLEKEIFAFTTCPQYGRFCYQKAPEGVIVNSHYSYLKGQQAKMMAEHLGGCGAGRVYCAIQPNGKVTPCVFIPIEVGDLRKNSLSNIWRNSEVMKKLRDRTGYKGHCGSCEYRSMCGGCRARAYGYFDDFLAPDPGCINNKDVWEKLTEKQAAAAID